MTSIKAHLSQCASHLSLPFPSSHDYRLTFEASLASDLHMRFFFILSVALTAIVPAIGAPTYMCHSR
jgi:hypothetical protein